MKLLLNRVISVLLLSTAAISLHAVAGRDIKTEAKTIIATCTQKESNCAATVNAVGEVITLDVKTKTAEDLGPITEETKVTISLPKEKETSKLYSLTPMAGESKDQKIYILFRNVEQPKGTRLAGRTVIIAYRQFAGQKSNQWTEVGRINSNVPLETADLTLMPDGVAKVANPRKPGEMIIFSIGKKNFRA